MNQRNWFKYWAKIYVLPKDFSLMINNSWYVEGTKNVSSTFSFRRLHPGLTFIMLGNVRNVLQSPCPPPHQLTPLASMKVPSAYSSMAPLPATRESPRAPITSMSPGRKRWTLSGLDGDLNSNENRFSVLIHRMTHDNKWFFNTPVPQSIRAIYV